MTKIERELRTRIAVLEREVAALKAQPAARHEYHYHYHYPSQTYITPYPTYSNPLVPTIWYGPGGVTTSGYAIADPNSQWSYTFTSEGH